MNKYFFLVVVGLVAVLSGYFIFSTNTEKSNQEPPKVTEESMITGTVTNVDRSQLMLDGPTLITLVTDDGTTKIVAVPSMGINLCVAAEQIADTAQLAVGDTVTVRGSEDENGAIVPCNGTEDELTITGRMLDATYGYEFDYRKGPDGYITLEDNASKHKDYVTGILLYNAREYEELMASDEPREGPPAMRMRMYRNPEKLSSSVWVIRNEREVNHDLMVGEESEAVISGANATQFLTTGLFTTEVYVVAHGAHIYVLMGDYFDTDSAIYGDFRDMVNSFTFIPDSNSGGSVGKINPRVACESALAYMTFASGAEADAFVEECVNGAHPEVIERYLRDAGFDGTAI